MKFKFIYTLLAAATFTSCSNFDDLNTNPDSTTKVTSDMLATTAIKSSFMLKGDAKAIIAQSTLPKFVTMCGDYPAEQYNAIGTCGFSSYTILPNLDKMIEYSAGLTTESAFKGLASFIKAYNFYRLTMTTGDIPCSQANQGLQGNRTPVYDTQKEVFDQVLTILAEADQYFSNAKNFGGDFVYNGDVEKWRKATNALRLKVLMALSKKITPEQKQMFAEIVASSPLMTDNSDNLAIAYTTTTGTWHPLYNQTLFDPYTMVSTVVADEMIRLQDRRLFYFGEPAEAEIEAGKSESDFAAYVGADPSRAVESLTVEHSEGKYSVINKRYITEQAGDPLLILGYPEQCFIIAEAIELGWISGDSRAYYEDGVRAGMKLVASYDKENKYNHGMPIDDAYIETYLAGEAAYKASKEDRLKQIWMQKYFTKFLQDGTDAYFDFRRTGYPVLPLDPNTNQNIDNKNGFPMRWKYPEGEYQTNKANIDAALKRQFTNGYDGTNELMWILKD